MRAQRDGHHCPTVRCQLSEVQLWTGTSLGDGAWLLVSTWQEAAPPQKALLGWQSRGAGDVQHTMSTSSSAGSVTQSCGTHAIPAERLLCWGQLYAIPDIPGQGVQRSDRPYKSLGQNLEIMLARMSLRSLLVALLRNVPNTQKPPQTAASRDAPKKRVPSQLSRLRKSFLQGLD